MTDYPESFEHDAPDEERPEFSPEVLDLVDQAWDALEDDEVERAVELFHQARDLEPDNSEIDVELAEALFEMGRHDEAAAICQTVMATSPETPRARRLLALALHERGDDAEALPLLEVEVAENPDDAHLHVGLGDILASLQRPTQAIESYRTALELDPSCCSAHHGWGLCLAQLENFAAAVDHYQAALALDPNLPEVWLAWGELLITLKDWLGARERLRRAVEIDEEFAEAWESLSYVCDHLGDPDEAFVTLRRAIFWNSDREELLDYLATTYHPHLDFARSWDLTLSGRYLYADAVPPERSESHRFRRSYQVWAPDRDSALRFIEEIESAMWRFEYTLEEIAPGPTASDCHGGVVFLSDRLYESPLPG
jgi:tetratricopeptide (TPR) repeat protein